MNVFIYNRLDKVDSKTFETTAYPKSVSASDEITENLNKSATVAVFDTQRDDGLWTIHFLHSYMYF